MNHIKSRKISDLVLGLFILVLGIILAMGAAQITTGASLQQGGDHMPKIVSIFLIILGLCQILFAERRAETIASDDSSEELSFKKKTINFILEFITLFVYIFFLKKVGFIVMTTLFVFVQSYLITPKPKVNFIKMAVLAVLTSTITYYVFVNAFSLMLPVGILG